MSLVMCQNSKTECSMVCAIQNQEYELLQAVTQDSKIVYKGK